MHTLTGVIGWYQKYPYVIATAENFTELVGVLDQQVELFLECTFEFELSQILTELDIDSAEETQ